MKIDWSKQRVWVIGASSGIGAEFAKAAQKRGAKVAISARNLAQLETVAAGTMEVVALDVENTDQVFASADEVRNKLGGIDIVVILAGYWQRMDALNFDLVEFKKHIHVNVDGMANVIAAVMPKMLSDNQGMIVGVSSVAGYRGMPGAEGYGASKAAQLNLLEALRTSLSNTNVKVQTVSPGFVKTPMTSTNTFPMPFLIEASEAAEHMIRGIEKNKAEVVFPFPMMALMKLSMLIPQKLWPKIMRGKKS